MSYYGICRTEYPGSGERGSRIVRCGRPDIPGHDVHWEMIDGEAGPSWTMPDTPSTPEPPRTPDLPCPKCGDTDVRMAYCNGKQIFVAMGRICDYGDPEHFHRTCQRCHVTWRTDDVIATQAVRADG